MITVNKLKEHSIYNGDGDMYVRDGRKIITGDEWSFIDSLLQDWSIIKGGLALEDYISIFERKLTANFDSADTIAYFKSMKNY